MIPTYGGYKMVTKATFIEKQRIRKGRFHTRVSFTLVCIASFVMLFIGFKNLGSSWGDFAFLQAGFVILGYFGTQIMRNEPIFPKQFAPMEGKTGFQALIVLAAALISQVIVQVVSQIVYSTTPSEQALYFVFAAVCEEMFFRAFLMTTILEIGKRTIHAKILAVIISSVSFAATHVNYYGSYVIWGVLLGGIVFGILYLVFNENITSLILGHFALNIIATAQWLVLL